MLGPGGPPLTHPLGFDCENPGGAGEGTILFGTVCTGTGEMERALIRPPGPFMAAMPPNCCICM